METINNFTTEKIEVDIDLVQPNPANPNKQTKEMFTKQVESIKQFGLLGTITVRKWGELFQILGGEHRWKACKELGYTKILVENVGEMSDSDANALLIVLNMQGEKDILQISKIIESLNNGQQQLLPYSEEEIENIKKLSKFDFSQFNEQKEIKKEVKDLIHLTVREVVYDVWIHCCEVANKENKTQEQMLVMMMDQFLAVFEGRGVGEKGLDV